MRVIDADALTKQIAITIEDSCMNGLWKQGMNYALGLVKAQPPIQPEIMRCKDCDYHYKRICPIEKYFSLDGFCSRGKRREVTE